MSRSEKVQTHPCRGIWPVLVTPYDDGLKIDLSAYQQMIEWHIEKGCQGIYALCLSSEMHLLTEDERALLIKEAVRIVGGRVPVAVTGNIDSNLGSHIDSCKRAHDLGADIVMLTLPAEFQSDGPILNYFLNILEGTDFPLGIYECPFPRHYHLSVKTIDQLAHTDRFLAFKETSCDPEKIKSILHITTGTKLSLLQANIPFLIEALLAGAEGSMNVVANWLPDMVTGIYRQVKEGKLKAAQEMHRHLCILEMAQRSIHPSGVKYLMSKRGLKINPRTRYPKKISKEEMKSLDLLSDVWFDANGNLAAHHQENAFSNGAQ